MCHVQGREVNIVWHRRRYVDWKEVGWLGFSFVVRRCQLVCVCVFLIMFSAMSSEIGQSIWPFLSQSSCNTNEFDGHCMVWNSGQSFAEKKTYSPEGTWVRTICQDTWHFCIFAGLSFVGIWILVSMCVFSRRPKPIPSKQLHRPITSNHRVISATDAGRWVGSRSKRGTEKDHGRGRRCQAESLSGWDVWWYV